MTSALAYFAWRSRPAETAAPAGEGGQALLLRPRLPYRHEIIADPPSTIKTPHYPSPAATRASAEPDPAPRAEQGTPPQWMPVTEVTAAPPPGQPRVRPMPDQRAAIRADPMELAPAAGSEVPQMSARPHLPSAPGRPAPAPLPFAKRVEDAVPIPPATARDSPARRFPPDDPVGQAPPASPVVPIVQVPRPHAVVISQAVRDSPIAAAPPRMVPPAPPPPAHAARAAPAPPPPSVQVTIGRIEIRAAMPAPPAPRRKPAPAMSLDDYLAARGNG